MAGELGEEWCYETLRRVRWPRGIGCPVCGGSRVTTHSRSRRSPLRRYLCLVCRGTFTDLTGTPFARTNLPVSTWFRCLGELGHPQTTAELARALGVKWDTAAQLRRRLVTGLSRSALLRQLHQALEEAGHV